MRAHQITQRRRYHNGKLIRHPEAVSRRVRNHLKDGGRTEQIGNRIDL